MRKRRQAGFSVIEVIVALALSGLVLATIFPVFLLVNRITTTWTDQAQARAVGLIAEQALARDLRQYVVAQHAACEVGCPDRSQLILETETDANAHFCVYYSIEGRGDSQLPRLVRTVRGSGAQTASTVAHGVSKLATSEGQLGRIRVDMTFAGFGGQPVALSPAIFVTPRLAGAAAQCG